MHFTDWATPDKHTPTPRHPYFPISPWMSQITTNEFRFQDLLAPIADKILSQLSNVNLATLHVASTSTFSLCYEYLRHGREASRLQREKTFQEKYSGRINNL